MNSFFNKLKFAEVRYFLKKHTSLFMMMIGTVSLLFINLLLKVVLGEIDYGKYSIFITYISVLGTFGLFGMDMVFLRTSHFNGEVLNASKTLIKVIVGLGLFASFIFSLLLKYFYLNEIPFLLLFVLTYLSIGVLTFYNFFRLRGSFFTSQFINSVWKVVFLFGLVTVFLFDFKINLLFISYLYLLSLILSLIPIVLNSKVLSIQLSDTSIDVSKSLKLGSGFLISLIIVSFLNFGERFLIESKIGLVELGNYFFMATIFLFPFTFLQGYIGFKDLILFKTQFSIKFLKRKLLFTFLFGIALGLFLVILFLLSNYFNLFNTDFLADLPIIVILVLMGILKLCYSVFSAAIGATIDESIIIKFNLLTFLFISIILFISFVVELNLYQILLLFLISWIFRIITCYYYLLVSHQINVSKE